MTDCERFNQLLDQRDLSLAEIPEFLALLDRLDPAGKGVGLLGIVAPILKTAPQARKAARLNKPSPSPLNP